MIRPQTALLVPAVAWAVTQRGPIGRAVWRVVALLEWSLAVAAGLGLGAWPLIAAGVWPDFLESLEDRGVRDQVQQHDAWHRS